MVYYDPLFKIQLEYDWEWKTMICHVVYDKEICSMTKSHYVIKSNSTLIDTFFLPDFEAIDSICRKPRWIFLERICLFYFPVCGVYDFNNFFQQLFDSHVQCCYNGTTNTVAFIWESTKPGLCSKLSLFKKSWQMLKVLPQFNPLVSYQPYLRAFKWVDKCFTSYRKNGWS